MTTAQNTGPKRFFFPVQNLEDVADAFHEDWQIIAPSFAPTKLNTPRDSASYKNYFLQYESEGQEIEGLCVRWTRGYYQVPPSWDDWQSMTYTFPGYPGYIYNQPGGTNNPTLSGRNSFQLTVESRLHYDYFVADPNSILSTTSGGVTTTNAGIFDAGGNLLNCVPTPASIPILAKLLFTIKNNPQDYVDPPSAVPVGGLEVGGNFFFETVPSQAAYQAWAANAAANGWNSTTSGSQQGQIVAENSQLVRLMGNIWARITRYVLAQ